MASTGWAVMVAKNFNPFALGGKYKATERFGATLESDELDESDFGTGKRAFDPHLSHFYHTEL